MRRDFVAWGARLARQGSLQLLVPQAKSLLHRVELRLLADHGLVERFQQVFSKGDFGFKFLQASFHQGFPSRVASLNSGVTGFSSRG
jgi:hypothetical protein